VPFRCAHLAIAVICVHFSAFCGEDHLNNLKVEYFSSIGRNICVFPCLLLSAISPRKSFRHLAVTRYSCLVATPNVFDVILNCFAEKFSK
jgi:hypothetical protein